jgi:hypothetical protein
MNEYTHSRSLTWRRTAAAAAALLPVTALAFLAGARTAPQAAPAERSATAAHLTLVPVHLSGAAADNAQLAGITWYHIANADGQCLDADSNHWGQNGDIVQLWSCNNHGEQLWTVNDWGAWWGPHIENYDGQCLDADSNTFPANGTKIQLWSCNGNPEQGWDPPGIDDDPQEITNTQSSDYCLDADSNYWGQNGDKVQVWVCNDHPEQNWPTS